MPRTNATSLFLSHSFYGYLGAVYPVMYDPGYEREDTTVSDANNLYATSKPDAARRRKHRGKRLQRPLVYQMEPGVS